MEKNSNSKGLRQIIWPIETEELKKFLPMAFMMLLILFNYSMLRSIKDGFVVTHIGAESISFLKLYGVLPFAIIFMVIYAKLCNVLSPQNVFYSISTFFAVYLAIFAYVLYPDPDAFHPYVHIVEGFALNYPYLKWFVRIAGKWTYASFYIMSELWGSVMLTLLFWQFANQITKTQEAKRFYSMFGLIGNLGLLLTGYILSTSLDGDDAAKNLGFEGVITITIISTVLVMAIYWWMQKSVLTDPRFYDSSEQKSGKKKKAKLSLSEGFKMIFTSKYLGLIATLVISYGISINLVEGVWKAKIKLLYPTAESYTAFMGMFQFYQGIAAMLFMIVGSNILRLLSWRVAALITPVMILITGAIFFSFIVFDSVVGMYLTGLMISPLALAVMVGTAQNVLSKATKYSLFDSTKEMAYIPLDDEMKSKGKAAVDVVGGRLGKSGGAIIQSTLFIILPNLTFQEATPILAVFFFVIVVAWTYAVAALSKEYQSKVQD
jgi:ATP:ADP antiporter, AAA family